MNTHPIHCKLPSSIQTAFSRLLNYLTSSHLPSTDIVAHAPTFSGLRVSNCLSNWFICGSKIEWMKFNKSLATNLMIQHPQRMISSAANSLKELQMNSTEVVPFLPVFVLPINTSFKQYDQKLPKPQLEPRVVHLLHFISEKQRSGFYQEESFATF